MLLDGLFLPALAALAAGITLYLIKYFRQRTAIQESIVSEINSLIKKACEMLFYLGQSHHSWVNEGQVVRETPVFLPQQFPVFRACLPQLFHLSRQEINKLLSFYRSYELCDQLIAILFHRIEQQEQSGQPLVEKQVVITKARIQRINAGLVSLCQVTNLYIRKLKQLPKEFRIPSAEEVQKKMDF